MLVTLAEILKKADDGNYAVVAPDFTTMYSIRYQLEVAEKYKAPLILSYTKHIRPLCPTKTFDKWIKIIREEAEQYNIDVCIHLDHGTSLEECKEAIDAGFTGVMIDASTEPFEKNVEITSKVVELAHKAGIPVEAEIGHVGTAVDTREDAHLTQPDEAKKFVELTGVDCLAVAIGTVHGEYKGKPHIDFERLAAIDKAVPVPLVIHGGSGTGDENIKKAVSLGIRKINVFHDWIYPSQMKTAEIIAKSPKAVGEIADAMREIIYDVLGHWFEISNSVNKG